MNNAAERHACAYGRAAAAYRRLLDPTLARVAERIVTLGCADERTRLLDVATGTGAIARAAQARGATVVGVDIAERMLAIARATSPSEIAFLRADAAQLPLRDASFDVVTCGFALSHMPDVATVLRETRRVLIAGGRFVASSWGDGSNPASAAILDALQRRTGPNIYVLADVLDERTWADAEHASQFLADAGFRVSVITEPLDGRFPDPEAALEWTLAWPNVGETLLALPATARREFEQEALAAAADAELSWSFTINYFIGDL